MPINSNNFLLYWELLYLPSIIILAMCFLLQIHAILLRILKWQLLFYNVAQASLDCDSPYLNENLHIGNLTKFPSSLEVLEFMVNECPFGAVGAQKGYLRGNPFGYRSLHLEISGFEPNFSWNFHQKLLGLHLGISEFEPNFSGNFHQKIQGLQSNSQSSEIPKRSPSNFWRKFPEKHGSSSEIPKRSPGNFWRK